MVSSSYHHLPSFVHHLWSFFHTLPSITCEPEPVSPSLSCRRHDNRSSFFFAFNMGVVRAMRPSGRMRKDTSFDGKVFKRLWIEKYPIQILAAPHLISPGTVNWMASWKMSAGGEPKWALQWYQKMNQRTYGFSILSTGLTKHYGTSTLEMEKKKHT